MIAGDLHVSYSHKPMYCFWNDMCISKTSAVTGTSGNLAAILDFWHISTSHEIRSTAIRKLAPENIGVAVGILSICALELDIYLGVFLPASCRQTSQKTVTGRRVNGKMSRQLSTQM